MGVIRLSICIPVYNFGSYLGETLNSILGQMHDDNVEVLVVDGASTDNTSDVVFEFQKNHTQLKYYRLDEKGGIDADIAKSVDLARGEYCWLFGGDDLMAPGALERALHEISQGHDLYLFKHANYTLDMKLFLIEYPVLKLSKDSVFNLSDRTDRYRYFTLAQTTEAFFSFMGGIIIKRSQWCSVPLNQEFIGTCWAHAARIFELISTGITLKFLAASYVDKRGGNDSFVDKGIVNRFRISIDGYNKIGDTFFGRESIEAFHIRRVIRYEYPLRKFLYAKLLCEKNPISEDRDLLDTLVRKTYSDASMIAKLNRFIYWVLPVWLFSPAWYVYRRVSPKMRKNKVRY